MTHDIHLWGMQPMPVSAGPARTGCVAVDGAPDVLRVAGAADRVLQRVAHVREAGQVAGPLVDRLARAGAGRRVRQQVLDIRACQAKHPQLQTQILFKGRLTSGYPANSFGQGQANSHTETHSTSQLNSPLTYSYETRGSFGGNFHYLPISLQFTRMGRGLLCRQADKMNISLYTTSQRINHYDIRPLQFCPAALQVQKVLSQTTRHTCGRQERQLHCSQSTHGTHNSLVGRLHVKISFRFNEQPITCAHTSTPSQPKHNSQSERDTPARACARHQPA